ncbi:hypothetical protein V8E53_007421 [Lactarius tabidus]
MTVAKHVKRHLDKAIRYLLDSDPTPKKCTDPIWLLCVQHPIYEFAPAEATSPTHSHAWVPSTQGMHPPPLPRHLQQCSCSCRQQRALVIPNDIQNTPTHIAHQNPMEISCHASESHLAPTSTPSETRHVPSSSANRPRPSQPESQRQALLILRRNVGDRVVLINQCILQLRPNIDQVLRLAVDAVKSFPDALLGISVTVDGQIFQTDVYSASHLPTRSQRPRKLLRLGGVPSLCSSVFGLSVGIAGGRASSSYFFVGPRSDNLFYLDPHRISERDFPIRQATPSRSRCRCHPPTIILPRRLPRPVARTHLHSASPSPLSERLSTSSSSSGGAHVRWNSAGANGGGSVLPGEASDSGLDPTLVHYVTTYSAAELRTFHSTPSMQSGRVIQESIVSIVDKLPSWSDADDSLEAMSDPEEDENDIPDDKDSTRWDVGDRGGGGGADMVADGDGDGDACNDKDSSSDFFDAGEGAIIPGRLSLRPASESGKSGSGGGNKDNPIGPLISTTKSGLTRSNTSCAARTTPPAFPPPPPIITRTKSSSSAKNRKRKEARAQVPFLSSVAGGAQEDKCTADEHYA